jgi:hypothetical protein
MRLNNLLFLFLFSFYSIFTQGQITNFKEKFDLPDETKETSGLLFLDGKIITHNDSGNNANLFEIDSLSGNLLRTISISNATNIDWEDITEDENHIYIADIGNNNGNRTDLKIYKIIKSDFKKNTSVSAEIISFSYEDQTDFDNKPNASNFDAESIVIFDNSILIFTKNWADLKTNVYQIPLTTGNYVAKKISSANIEGLITGGVYNDGRFFLTGYNTTLIPFLIYISPNRKPGEDIFFSGFDKITLENKLGQGSQLEGITNIGITGKYYISREHFTTIINGNQYDFTQKLYEFYDETSPLLSTDENKLGKIIISPNPVTNKVKIHTDLPFLNLEIYNSLGKKMNILLIDSLKEIDISYLEKGVYFLKIQYKNRKSTVRKIIKL